MSDRHRPAWVPTTLVWGGWNGSRNVGDDAILLGIKHLYQRLYGPGTHYLRALTTDRDQTASLGVTGESALVKREAILPWAWARMLRIFASPDLVVVSGGTPVFDHSHAIRTLYLTLPILFGVPFVVFGAGVKPLRSWYGRRVIPRLLRRARYVSVRDEDSQRILESLGVPDVRLTADSAFFAPAGPASDVDALLAALHIAPDARILVVAPRLLSTEGRRLYLEEPMTPRLIAEHPAQLAAVIDRVAGRFDTVLLVPMHFHGPDSDLPLMNAVRAASRAGNLRMVEHELDAPRAIALLARAQVVLATRLHALLLAASMGTPVVGIAYEEKVRGLLTRLGLAEFGVDLKAFDVEAVVQRVERALAEHTDLHAHLLTRVSELRALVLRDLEMALGVPARSA